MNETAMHSDREIQPAQAPGSYSASRPTHQVFQLARSNKKSVACYRCHAQKIKCSGEKPCSRCRSAGYGDQCRYASRDRKIRVDESYFEQLVKDSQLLHCQGGGGEVHREEDPTRAIHPNPDDSRLYLPNDLIPEEQAPQSEIDSVLPIRIGETACTAFATRICQSFNGSDQPTHPLQWHYVKESALTALLNMRAETPWPSLAQAKLLVKTAIGHINPAFHLTLKKDTIDLLSSVYQKAKFNIPAIKCKFFALFALGQVYSALPDATNATVPGTPYFARALSLIQILPERPSMIHVESLLCIALFSQFLNRFHSAYLLVGNALRLGLSLGLNYNSVGNESSNPTAREHRVRLWWSIYVMDRFWGLKSGFPAQVNDEDIHVDLPNAVVSESYGEQFADHAIQIASIEIARLAGNTTRELYGRKQVGESFLQREQKLLIQQRKWKESLPDDLKFPSDKPASKHTVILHLQFNYCVILAIRPVLLHTLSSKIANNSYGSTETISPTIRKLCETCVDAAKHSLAMCVNGWTSGSLALLSYDFPAFLFSSALVLLVSHLVSMHNSSEMAAVDTAREMLQILGASGNLSAKDLSMHLEFVMKCSRKFDYEKTSSTAVATEESPKNAPASPSFTNDTISLQPRDFHPPLNSDIGAECATHPVLNSDLNSQNLTTQMALHQATMQGFLSQTEIDVATGDPAHLLNDPALSIWWPTDPLYTE